MMNVKGPHVFLQIQRGIGALCDITKGYFLSSEWMDFSFHAVWLTFAVIELLDLLFSGQINLHPLCRSWLCVWSFWWKMSEHLKFSWIADIEQFCMCKKKTFQIILSLILQSCFLKKTCLWHFQLWQDHRDDGVGGRGGKRRRIWIRRTRSKIRLTILIVWRTKGDSLLAPLWAVSLASRQPCKVIVVVEISTHRLRASEQDGSPLMFGGCALMFADCMRSFLLVKYIFIPFERERQWCFDRYIIFSLGSLLKQQWLTCCRSVFWLTLIWLRLN